MGIMPPYDPFQDPQLAWAIARVASCEPGTATWGAPALVRFDLERVLRGALPRSLVALFDAPREAQQSRFYVARALGTDPSPEAAARAAAQQAALDATPIELPPRGARVLLWLGEHVVPTRPDPSVPPSPFGAFAPGATMALPAEGVWLIPTLRLHEASALPMRSRWIDLDPRVEREVLERLGVID